MGDKAFYHNLADALIADLPNEEKNAPSLWLKRLSEIEDELGLKYIKLLILSQQKSIKSSPFGRSPPENHEKFTEILENFWGSISGEKSSDFDDKSKKINISISGDLREYFALQEVNDSLMHGYYGISVDGPLFKDERENLEIELLSDDRKLLTDEIEEFMKNNADELQETFEKSCKCDGKEKRVVSNKTRPCWGRNRYMERLIDQSPHPVGDLDAVGINAMLQNIQNRRKK